MNGLNVGFRSYTYMCVSQCTYIRKYVYMYAWPVHVRMYTNEVQINRRMRARGRKGQIVVMLGIGAGEE